jgi:hypothetical protein
MAKKATSDIRFAPTGIESPENGGVQKGVDLPAGANRISDVAFFAMLLCFTVISRWLSF